MFHCFRVPNESIARAVCHDCPANMLCLTVPKNFVRNPSVFQNFWGCEKFFLKKSVYLDVLSKLFCLTAKEHFEEESFCVSEIFWCRKFSGTKGCGMEAVSRFSVTNCCLKMSKHFVEESFRTSIMRLFRRLYFVLQYRHIS